LPVVYKDAGEGTAVPEYRDKVGNENVFLCGSTFLYAKRFSALSRDELDCPLFRADADRICTG
jgi:hypothetical protein